jgi:hypothetical protein
MSATDSTYSFFSYARSGLATSITKAPATGTRPGVSIDVTVNNGQAQKIGIELYGPGDITRLDAAQVVRTNPTDGTANHPPYLFPMIEFARPELPWAFTPQPPGTTSLGGPSLQPWLALVVVERDLATLDVDQTGAALPKLTAPGSELPRVEEAWAWAHVQVSGTSTASGAIAQDGTLTVSGLQDVEANAPERVVSRLLCPRQLKAQTPYLACVVPTFADGAAAGVGGQLKGTLDPAWETSQTQVTLPVYYHWTFITGEQGDFSSLARRLSAMASPSAMGTRALDATSPGGGLPSAGQLMLQGALGPTHPQLGAEPAGAFQTALEQLLDAPATLGAGTAVLPPPMYGRWPARVTTVPPVARIVQPLAPTGSRPVPLEPAIPGPRRPSPIPLPPIPRPPVLTLTPWLRRLNLDPRHRAAAEFGALVVRREADALMASAWEQLGDLQRANQALRQAQLARTAGRSIHSGRLRPRADAAVLALTAPVHSRIAATTGRTVHATLARSTLSNEALGPAMRRLLRPAGPLARRFDPTGALRIDSVVGALTGPGASTALVPARTAPGGTGPGGTQTDDAYTTKSVTTLSAPASGTVSVSALTSDGTRGSVSVSWSTFTQVVGAAQQTVGALLAAPDPGPAAPPPAGLAGQVLAGLDPESTVPARLLKRLTFTDPAWHPSDPIEPIMAAPSFPAPLWESLRKLSQQLIAPGLEQIPPETVTVLRSNSTFINAFMVGANHELARQLLWRHFPTDQRGTYFRQFWDPSAAVPPSGGSALDLHDIPPIDQWRTNDDLDVVAGGESTSLLFLVVRGELLRRFPNASIYAVPSDGQSQPGPVFPGTPGAPATATEKYPHFQGRLEPDITFFGFDMAASDAHNWFFVIQQHPTEPHWGIEPADPLDRKAGNTNNPWAAFSWADLAGSADSSTLVYAPVAPSGVTFPEQGKWGRDAATMAAITLRDPYRVAIYADALVNPK